MFGFKSYLFWLIVVSLLCFLLERIFPWRKQKILRPQFMQDLFWLIFNGYYLAVLFGPIFSFFAKSTGEFFLFLGIPQPSEFNLANNLPLAYQVIILLFLQDFIEWIIHNMLHRIPLLWELHKLHHSIKIMDWIGNFRFHWLEVFVYKTIKFLPLAIMGFNTDSVLIVAVIATLIGHLNHSNVKFNYGPLKYILNSPQMHIWHHDIIMHKKGGQNFGIVLSLWDWLFGTAYLPKGQPAVIGFEGDDKYPSNLMSRFLYPASKLINS